MLVRGVVDHELGDDAELAPLGFLHEAAEIRERAEIRIDLTIIGDVVAVVAPGRGIERKQPQRGDAEVLQIVELLGQSFEIADPVVVAVGEGLDVQLIDDGVLVPELVAGETRFRFDVGQNIHGVTAGNGRGGPGPGPARCEAVRRPIR